MHSVTATCPTRIDLAGGTLDIWPLHLLLPEPGVTVNVALDVPGRASVELRPSEARIQLASVDQSTRVEHPDREALLADLRSDRPRLPLLGHAFADLGLEGGVRIQTEAMSPKGAGLGGSSALMVALVGALAHAADQDTQPRTLVKLAHDIETRILGTPTGYQDFHPPFHGGCLALEGAPGGVVVERLVDVDLDRLGDRLRLIYTGEPRHSGITNWGVIKAFMEKRPRTVSSLEAIAENARVVRAALRQGDLEEALKGVVRDGTLRKRMAPRISTPAIKQIDEHAKKAGALGTKILGAGGGGCVLVVLSADQDPAQLEQALADAPGQALPLRLMARGITYGKG